MDRFYTSDKGFDRVKEIIGKNNILDGVDLFVDFSAGDDRFCKSLNIKTESYDIEPSSPTIHKMNWFDVGSLKNSHTKLAIGLNPPFGYRSNEAKKFVVHALKFVPEIILLIVPRSFKFQFCGYALVLQENLEEDIFFKPESLERFCFPTKFVVFKKQISSHPLPLTIKRNTSTEYVIRVAGYITKRTQLLIRRAGVYANEQFYCIVGTKVEYFDRGTWYRRNWDDNNHSVQEGGDVSKVHGSSNPKRSGNEKNSKTGWSWYKVDFQKRKTIPELKKLAMYLYNNPPESKLQRSQDINILAKSSPPNINTAHLYPLFEKYFNIPIKM